MYRRLGRPDVATSGDSCSPDGWVGSGQNTAAAAGSIGGVFDTLSDRLEGVFRRLRGHGRLSEAQVDEALREVRLALLEADVHLDVVRDFIARIRERAVGEEVRKALTPAQTVIKIVSDELVAILGGANKPLRYSPKPPTVIM